MTKPDKYTIVLRDDALRAQAAQLVYRAPEDTHVTFQRGDKRTISQNAMLWPLLRVIAKKVEWYGQYLTPDDWKHIFTAALRGYEAVPGLDRGTMVVLGQSTSKMTKSQFSDLIEIILAFAATHGVELPDPRMEKVA